MPLKHLKWQVEFQSKVAILIGIWAILAKFLITSSPRCNTFWILDSAPTGLASTTTVGYGRMLFLLNSYACVLLSQASNA